MIDATRFWLLVLAPLQTPQPAPVQSLILYRNDCALVRRTLPLALTEGRATLPLDERTVDGTWSFEVVEGKPPRRVLVVDRGSSVEWPGTDAPDPRKDLPRLDDVEFEFANTDPNPTIRTTALIAGRGWRPGYRLVIGPEGKGRLELTAELVGAIPPALEGGSIECALALPGVSPSGGSGQRFGARSAQRRWLDPSAVADATTFPIHVRPIARGVTQTLLDQEIPIDVDFYWEVAGPPGRFLEVPERDVVESRIHVQNQPGRSLPDGPVAVFEGDRLVCLTDFPYTPPGRLAVLRVGPTALIDVQREEIELERKKSAVRRENEPIDWVKMTGTLSLKNDSLRPAKMRVRKAFEGQGIAASDEGKILRRPNVVGKEAIVTEIRWELELAPGQSKKLTYGYEFNLGEPDE